MSCRSTTERSVMESAFTFVSGKRLRDPS
jgi:hypothetical protein